jgi:hypothetical protein
MPTFSEIHSFGKNHAVLEVQHLHPSINGKVMHHRYCRVSQAKKAPIIKVYLIAKS